MKKYIVIMLILTLVVSFLLGLYLYKLSKIDEQIAFETEYEKLTSKNTIKDVGNIIEQTSSIENVITPNTILVEKKYYNECEHLVEKEKKLEESLMNRNESELQIEYIGWEIQKFTPNEVVVYKEINDFCDEHYLLKDVNGKINVYKLDKYGKEKELSQKTEIETRYLPETDLEELQKGIKAYGNTDLNQLLQDFE